MLGSRGVGCPLQRTWNGTDAAYAMAVDSSGNVYVAGASLGTTFPDLDYATIQVYLVRRTTMAARYNSPGNGKRRATAIAIVYQATPMLPDRVQTRILTTN